LRREDKGVSRAVVQFQQVLNGIFGLLFSPFESMAPLWLMLWVSLVTAVLVLLVYKYFSSQEAIKEAKDRVKAHILEIRLFQDDPVLMGRAVRAVLGANLKYLSLNLKPFLFVFLPILLMLIQMEARFGYRPLRPNESTVVRTYWRSPHPGDATSGPALLPGDGLSLQSPPLRIGDGKEIDWRIRVDRTDPGGFVLETKDNPIALQVVVSEEIVPVSPRNVQKGAMDILWYPAGQPLPRNGDLLAAEIGYPRRDFELFGHTVHWVWPFLIVSLLAGYLLKGVFRVQF
jgi:uncharacterized membrane protein (DUF106 family)